ncbi:hypothetical protein E3N88_09529 [Mikania micrantha]|uniref:Uncharacterized protein n=1 Tax=Mikania micrantha TaxID=192012 RepID=A0A5N6PLL2_9ASTR|nr:hypothetical protein E3N88_09529 [Mikania micrantha]
MATPSGSKVPTSSGDPARKLSHGGEEEQQKITSELAKYQNAEGKQHALYDEDDEIEEDIGVLDGEGDGPMFGDNDTIDLDFY